MLSASSGLTLEAAGTSFSFAPGAHEGALAAHLLSLARLDLGGNALRLLLLLTSKAMATGQSSWTFPVDYLADQLGTHRNTVTRALADLQAGGLVRRVASAERGAPTRTELLARVAGLASPRRCEQPPVGPALPSCHPDAEVRPASSARAGRAADPGAPIAAPTPPRGVPAVAARLSPADLLAVQETLPAPARAILAEATLAGDPARLVIDPAWQLTAAQVAVMRASVPDRAVHEPVANSTPRVKAASAAPTADATGEAPETILRAGIQRELVGAMEALDREGRPGQLLVDEIAYMVLKRGLGRGDHAGGVRAAVSLIRRGTWQPPRMMPPAWRGATSRAASAAELQYLRHAA